MFIPHKFDEAMSERRARSKRIALQTAQKLNERMIHFLSDVSKNTLLSEAAKAEIKTTLLKNI